MKQSKTISICIPSYNRPKELLRLLKSIDASEKNVEIIICEDNSPKRAEIEEIVNFYISTSSYTVKLILNDENLGYDKNLKAVISHASGKYIVFMGDDDVFVPLALDKLAAFLEANLSLGYVLKSHVFQHKSGKVEPFRYFSETRFFNAGEETFINLFRKSVFISGFTIKRDYIQNLLIPNFDGTLLFQLYLLAEVSLNHNCAYFDVPLTKAYDEGIPFFGNSETERDLYTPGTITIENSINFLTGFFKITKFIDDKYQLNSTQKIKVDMSKYFYPSLAIQREKGLRTFFRYIKELNKIGFNCTLYYYFYALSLVICGKKVCDYMIVRLKTILGKTPVL